MASGYRFLLFVTMILYICQAGAQMPVCTSAYKGQHLTRAQLVKFIAEQRQTLNLCGTNLSGVDLSDLNLQGVNFYGADLSSVNLDNSNLRQANLNKTYFRWSSLKKTILFSAQMNNTNFQEADLSQADLRQGKLQHADFTSARLFKTNFSGAQLQKSIFVNSYLEKSLFNWANLSKANFDGAKANRVEFDNAKAHHANFSNADLTNSQFRQADLSSAVFDNSRLQKTDFFRANLNNVVYQPQLGFVPDLTLLATSSHFRTLRFSTRSGIPALSELRNEYGRLGVREMERKITSMLKADEMKRLWSSGGWGRLESALSFILFYVTSDYGSSPGRALKIFVCFVLLFSIPYFLALLFASIHHGIILKWYRRPATVKHCAVDPQFKTEIQILLSHHQQMNAYKKVKEALRLLRISFYFSLLSAFHIGWRELNVSTWLSRMQTREYVLQGRGWVRMLAGVQSLLSAYLIVIWVLTYFGKPFVF